MSCVGDRSKLEWQCLNYSVAPGLRYRMTKLSHETVLHFLVSDLLILIFVL